MHRLAMTDTPQQFVKRALHQPVRNRSDVQLQNTTGLEKTAEEHRQLL
jgi:hypothetical protein